MKKILLLLFLLIFCSCSIRINPAAQYGVQAPMSAWYNTTDRWQIEYVAWFVDFGNRNGVRCPQPLSVGAIRYELLTRMNQGRISGSDLVYQQIDKILAESGCEIAGIKAAPVPVLEPIVVPPPPEATINAAGKRIPIGTCENLRTRSETLREYGCI
jgi:hypothetical protein